MIARLTASAGRFSPRGPLGTGFPPFLEAFDEQADTYEDRYEKECGGLVLRQKPSPESEQKQGRATNIRGLGNTASMLCAKHIGGTAWRESNTRQNSN